ncbi:hypothetical protein V0R52_12645 [Pseudomonas asiatica]|uniref:hypothetical protein n=1 Tax=Pseudomonas TaxID=286 RepID=UPI002555ADD5|nr:MULTISPECIES: hypothetical protein [Pseudomonas]MDM9552987.1 hypothetical protein [Pseudomonas asiatica]MEE1917245.1 hypothetical protein [Pseudomonas asiatica]WIV23064.1 hypothetical protein QN085_20670 [Pseudomonas sp. M2(2023)]
MATRGRKPGSPKVPGSGRVKGKSLDRGERQLVTSQMAGDIMAVYEAMGGVDWLLKFAQANPKEFIQQGLSRLFPAAQKEGDDTGGGNHNTQNNYYMTPLEAAQRVAFALSVGARELEKQAVTIEHRPASDDPVTVEPEMSPQEACRWVAPDQPNPSPHQDDFQRDMARDAARQRWIDELPLTDEQRADAAVVRETVERDITNYRGGSSAEQYDAPRRPSADRPTPGDRRRAVMSRRGRDLL